MAALDNIPGLAGYLQQSQINQQQGLGQLQQASGAAQLVGALQSQAIQRRQQEIVNSVLPGLLSRLGLGGGTPALASGANTPTASGTSPNALPGTDLMLLGGLIGMPGLEKVGQAQFEAGKGIAQRPGAPVVNPFTGAEIAPAVPAVAPGAGAVIRDPSNPSGFRVEQVPGQVPAAATLASAVTGSQTGAKVPYETTNVQAPGGGEITVPKAWTLPGGPLANLAAKQFGVGATSPGVAATAIPAPNNGSLAPERMAQRDAILKSEQDAVNQNLGPLPGAKAASADPWATIPKRPVAAAGMGQSTFDKRMSEENATSSQKLSEKYGAQADAANNRLALNQQALSLVDQADTGPLAARTADVKNWISKFVPGVKESDFENTPSATIALQKDLVNAATQKAKQQFGSRITQSEVMLMLTRGAPNVDMTKAAIKYLIGTDIAQSQYQIKQANDLGRYLSSGGDPMRFEGWYAMNFPASTAINQVHLGNTTGGQIRGAQSMSPGASGIKFLGFEEPANAGR